MKVCVLIMATEQEPSLSNVTAMRETFIKHCHELSDAGKLANEFDFFVYAATDDEKRLGIEDLGDVSMIRVKGPESVYRTFEKTYDAFKMIENYYDWDWFVRINISTFLNIKLLDNVIQKLDKNCVYSSAINAITCVEAEYSNDLYPRGDLMIFSDEMRKIIMKHGIEFIDCDKDLKNRIPVPHVDDVLIGLSLMKGLGDEYYEHLHTLRYNFFPDTDISFNPDRLAIGSRVKTIAPGAKYSGYSWDDNEYRRLDGAKMRKLDEFVRKYAFYGGDLKLKDVLQREDGGRPILVVQPVEIRLCDVKKYLHDKRKGRQ